MEDMFLYSVHAFILVCLVAVIEKMVEMWYNINR